VVCCDGAAFGGRSFAEERRLDLSLVLYLVSCNTFCWALDVPCLVATIAVGAFTLVGRTFCSRMIVGTPSALDFFAAVTYRVSESLAFVTLGEAKVRNTLLCLEALSFNDKLIDNVSVCCSSVFSKYGNRLVLLAYAIVLLSSLPYQGLDISDGDIVAVGILFLSLVNSVFIFGCLFVSWVQVDCPCWYAVDYNSVVGLVNLDSCVCLFPVDVGFFDSFCSFFRGSSHADHASPELSYFF